MKLNEKGQLGFYGVIAVLIGLLIAGLMSIAPVRYGTVKAVTFAGGLTGVVLDEGLNFKAPWQGTQIFVTQVQTYETSDNPNESQANFTDYTVSAQTSNGQQIEVSYTVKFRVAPDEVLYVLKNYGAMNMVVENVVKADSRSEARKLAQNYEAEALYSGEGIQVYEQEVEDTLRSGLNRAHIILVEFLIRKIDFDVDYVQAIENKQIAEENIATQRYNAEAAAYQRDQQIAIAEAEARKVVLLAEANAEAIALQGEVLEQYPSMLQWQLISKLNNVQWGFLPSDGIAALLDLSSLTEVK